MNSSMFWGIASLLMGVCALAASEDYGELWLPVGYLLLAVSVVLIIKGLIQKRKDNRKEREDLETSAIHTDEDDSLNRKLRSRKRSIRLCWTAFLAAIAFLMWLVAEDYAEAPLVIGTLAIMAALLLAVNRLNRGLQKFATDNILQQILERNFSQIEYSANDRIAEKMVKESNMGLPWFERFGGDDYLKAVYKGYDFAMSDIRLEKQVTTTDSDGKETTEYETVFRGQFLRCDLGWKLPTDVRLWTEASPRGSAGLSGMAFTEGFHVEASDPGKAHRVVGAALMQRIQSLKNTLGCGIHMHFSVSGRVYVAVETNQDFFEVGRGKHMDAAVMRRRFTQQVGILTAILDTLSALTPHEQEE